MTVAHCSVVILVGLLLVSFSNFFESWDTYFSLLFNTLCWPDFVAHLAFRKDTIAFDARRVLSVSIILCCFLQTFSYKAQSFWKMWRRKKRLENFSNTLEKRTSNIVTGSSIVPKLTTVAGGCTKSRLSRFNHHEKNCTFNAKSKLLFKIKQTRFWNNQMHRWESKYLLTGTHLLDRFESILCKTKSQKWKQT